MSGVRAPAGALAVERYAVRFVLDRGVAMGGEPVEFDGARGVLGPAPVAYQNAVFCTAAHPDALDRVIDEVRTELDRRGVPGSWHIGPRDRPRDPPGPPDGAGVRGRPLFIATRPAARRRGLAAAVTARLVDMPPAPEHDRPCSARPQRAGPSTPASGSPR